MSTLPSVCPFAMDTIEIQIAAVQPLVLGTVLNWALYGVLITQFYVYTYNFPDDGKRLKCLAYWIVFLETAQSGLALADLFHLSASVSEYGPPSLVDPTRLSVWDGPILVGCVTAVTVQSFFAYRIWALSEKKSWWLCLLILLFSAVGGISEVAGSIYSQVTSIWYYEGFVLWVLALVWLVGSVVTDVLITLSMLYLLKRRRREGTSGTSLFSKNALSKIVRLTVETNLLTTTVAITALVLFVVELVSLAPPNVNWCYCPIAILGKLYANALFASLNNRISIREGPACTTAIRFSHTTLSSGNCSKDTLDCTYFQLERPPSSINFKPSREIVRRSRENEGREDSESLVIDIA